MQIVILAAGESSRFEPFRESYQHKSLVKILGKTILEHTLDSLRNTAIRDVIIVVNKKEPFEQILGDGSKLGFKITYVILPKAEGMGEALLRAKDHLEDSFFLTNTNHVEIDQFVKEMNSKQGEDGVVLLVKKDTGFNTFGFVKTDKDRVVDVIEKPQKETDESLRIVGIYLLSKNFVDVLEKTKKEHYSFEAALAEHAKTGKVFFVKTELPTISLKYVWDLFSVKDYLLKKIKSYTGNKSEISKTAQITGDVFIGDNVKILDNVVIKGPCFIGDNSFIGTNSIVRNGSVIGEGVVVGAFIEVKNTIIMDGTSTHTGVLEDSIVGRNCKIAAGVVTANARLDRKNIFSNVKNEKTDSGLVFFGMIMGDNSQFGIRVSTMPGTIIGNNCIIGPSTVVMKNIASNTKYYTKFQQTIEEK